MFHIFAVKNERTKMFALREMCCTAYRTNTLHSWYEFFLCGRPLCATALQKV